MGFVGLQLYHEGKLYSSSYSCHTIIKHHVYYFIMLKHVMLSRVVPVNEEVNVVEPVPEEGHPLVEVGFDICGTDLELTTLSTKASLGCIQPSLCFTKFTLLMLMLCCIR
jgi:hypothetical protein